MYPYNCYSLPSHSFLFDDVGHYQPQQDFRESLEGWSIQYGTLSFGDYLVAMATVTFQLAS